MSKLNKRIFGEPKGILGDIVYKTRNGSTYMSLRPVKIKKRDSEEYRRRTAAFRMALNVCPVLTKIKVLKDLWRVSSLKGDSPYTKMMGLNIKNLFLSGELKDIALIPGESNFTASLMNAVLTDYKIVLQFQALGSASGLTLFRDPKISLQGLLHLSSPLDDKDKHDRFIPIYSDNLDTSIEEPITFETALLSRYMEQVNAYFQREIIINLITRDRQLEPVKISEKIHCPLIGG